MTGICLYCEDDFGMEADGCPHHCLDCCDCCDVVEDYDEQDEADEHNKIAAEEGRTDVNDIYGYD